MSNLNGSLLDAKMPAGEGNPRSQSETAALIATPKRGLPANAIAFVGQVTQAVPHCFRSR